MSNHIILDWPEYAVWAEALAEKVRQRMAEENKVFDCIVTIARGGLPLATILAHQLAIRDVHAVQVERYRDGSSVVTQEPRIVSWCVLGAAYFSQRPAEILLVDDLIDKNITVPFVRREIDRRTPRTCHAPHVTTAVMYISRTQMHNGAIYAQVKEDDDWIHFPYELRF